MREESIAIRSIQHWLYCPHRWGLLEIDRAWAENYYVTKSDLLHRRVHEEGAFQSKAKTCYTAVTVYQDEPEWGLYGVTDCIEVKNGVFTIVEHKPTKPKDADYHEDDLMQVFAQKLCVDYVFSCHSEGCIYYHDVRKRVKLPLSENESIYRARLSSILQQIRTCLRQGTIPPIPKGQNCTGCSMKDLCIPKLKIKGSVRQTIEEVLEGKR